MRRLDDEALTLHLEVALSAAAPALISDLQHTDSYRRRTATSTLARQLVQRMSCFEILSEDPVPVDHPRLF